MYTHIIIHIDSIRFILVYINYTQQIHSFIHDIFITMHVFFIIVTHTHFTSDSREFSSFPSSLSCPWLLEGGAVRWLSG